jgi:hypothetical protein
VNRQTRGSQANECRSIRFSSSALRSRASLVLGPQGFGIAAGTTFPYRTSVQRIAMPTTADEYQAFGFVTLATGDPKKLAHMIWCYNKVGREALGVVFAPVDVSLIELKAGLVESVLRAPERLFECEGVLNKKPLQCTGPFPVIVGGETIRPFVVNWCIGGAMRAFLIFGADDRESAMRPIHNWYLASMKKEFKGMTVLVSETIQSIVEFEDLGTGALQPKKDFTLARG